MSAAPGADDEVRVLLAPRHSEAGASSDPRADGATIGTDADDVTNLAQRRASALRPRRARLGPARKPRCPRANPAGSGASGAGPRVRRPLVALSAQVRDHETMMFAARLAQSQHSMLTIMIALDTSTPWWIGVTLGVDWEDEIRTARARAALLLSEAVRGLPSELPVTHRLLDGARRPHDQIRRAFRAGRHDVLILGRTCTHVAQLSRDRDVPILVPS